MSDPTPSVFRFESQALDAHACEVLRFEGTEEISRLYEFAIDLVSPNCAINLDDVIGTPATLVIARTQGERRINGIIAGLVQGDECEPGRYAYRATLVPRLWMLSQTRRSRIYQSKSIPEIVAEQLAELAVVKPDKAASADATETVVFRLKQHYPAREYRVQYAETDLDFMSRLLEHEGISYFFEQGEQCERLVITDHNDGFSSCSDGAAVTYAPTPDHVCAEAVRSLVCEQRSVPRKLVLNDYNYRLPQLPLQAESNIDGCGVGLIAEHETHFSTPEEGEWLSAVRAEEILCRQRTYTGNGDHGDFHAGHRYRLAAHFRADFNQDYLISRVRHTGGPSGRDLEEVTYRNAFESVPAAVTYRPERVTAKPKLHGIMSAHVDGSGPGDRAEIDDQGRYKLIMPFDLSGAREGDGSCFIRMAQPYGGKDHGMHFPLSRGTEVVWTCIGGDPDRPIITGTVPNPIHRSVVTSENADRNVLRTAGGVTMEFSDSGSPALDAPTGSQDTITPSSGFTGIPLREPDGSAQLSRQRQFVPATQDNEIREVNKWFKLYIPHHSPITNPVMETPGHDDSKISTYLRLGNKDLTDAIEKDWVAGGRHNGELELNNDVDEDTSLTGVFNYTEWNRTTITMHNNEQYVYGKNRITIKGGGLGLWDAGTAYTNYMRRVGTTFTGEPAWRNTTADHASSDSYQYGDTEDFFFGFKFGAFAGLETGVTLGGSLNLGVSGNVDIGASLDVEAKWGPSIDLCGSQNTMDAKNHDILCSESVEIRTKGVAEGAADAALAKNAKIAGGVYGVATAAAIAGSAVYSSLVESEDRASTWGSTMGITAATCAWAATLLYGYHKDKTAEASKLMAPSMFALTESDIKLAVGLPSHSTKGSSNSIEIVNKGVRLMSKRTAASGSKIQATGESIVLQAGGTSGPKIKITPTEIAFECGPTSVTLKANSFKATAPECGIVSTTGESVLVGTGIKLVGKGVQNI